MEMNGNDHFMKTSRRSLIFNAANWTVRGLVERSEPGTCQSVKQRTGISWGGSGLSGSEQSRSTSGRILPDIF